MNAMAPLSPDGGPAKGKLTYGVDGEKWGIEFSRDGQCAKKLYWTFKNNTAYRITSVKFRSVISAENNYVHFDQVINMPIEIAPYSFRESQKYPIRNGCFLQNSYSLDGLVSNIILIEATYVMTKEQMEHERRQKEAAAEAAAAAEAYQREEARKLAADERVHARSLELERAGNHIGVLRNERQAHYADQLIIANAVQGLSDQYADSTVQLTPARTAELIRLNQVPLAGMSDGTYRCYIDRQGGITSSDLSQGSLLNAADPQIGVINVEGYAIPVRAIFDINLRSIQTPDFGPDTVYHMSPRYAHKELRQSGSGKYFLRGFGAPFFADHVKGTYVMDPTLKANEVDVYKNAIFKVYANDILVGTSIRTVKTERIIASRGFGRMVTKIVTAPLWIPLGIIVMVL